MEAEQTRKNQYDVSPFFIERWSPRAFSDQAVADDDLLAILEAGHWAPSCFNEQPWSFIVAKTADARQKFVGFLTDSNKIWASKAPILLALVSKNTFSLNGKPNRWHSFDCGTAWGYMTMEAKRRGYITHAMGGFKQKEASAVLNLSEEYRVEAVIAIGKHGDIHTLPDELQQTEFPSLRKPLEEVIRIL